MSNTELTNEQCEKIRPLLPLRRRWRGRLRIDDRRELNGILCAADRVSGEDVPRKYASPAISWRRLRQWERDGTWERIWRALLSKLDEQGKLEWGCAFLDGCFIPAKKGRR